MTAAMDTALRVWEKNRVLLIALCSFSLWLVVCKQRLVANILFPANAGVPKASSKTTIAKDPAQVHYVTVSSKSSPKDDRPYFVLHLGPKKVGTTFLQSSLSSPKLTDVLLADNYVYLGKCPTTLACPFQMPKDCKGIFDRLILSSSERSDQLPNNTRDSELQNQALPKELRGNQSALLVDESPLLDNPAIAKILTSKYRVRVVLGYRRLYEWLVSEYNQEFKPAPLTTLVWGGKALLPFDVENRGPFTRQVENFKKTGRHPTHIRKDESYFPDVHIINQHALQSPPSNQHPSDVDPLLRHLVCEAMPNAKHSCQALENGIKPDEEIKSNSYVNFDYDRLAVAAFERGWVNTNTSSHSRNKSREQVVQHITEYDAQRTVPIAHYPHDCLGDEKLAMILKLSLTVEKNLFGAEAAAGWEEEHRQGFAAYKRKFCWVQTDAVLEDEEWKLFFMSL